MACNSNGGGDDGDGFVYDHSIKSVAGTEHPEIRSVANAEEKKNPVLSCTPK